MRNPRSSDDPPGIEREEAHEELYGARGPSAVGLGVLDVRGLAV